MEDRYRPGGVVPRYGGGAATAAAAAAARDAPPLLSEELLAELGGGGGGNAMLTAAKKKQRDGPGGGGVHGGAWLFAHIEPVYSHTLAASFSPACPIVPHCLLAVYSVRCTCTRSPRGLHVAHGVSAGPYRQHLTQLVRSRQVASFSTDAHFVSLACSNVGAFRAYFLPPRPSLTRSPPLLFGLLSPLTRHLCATRSCLNVHTDGVVP